MSHSGGSLNTTAARSASVPAKHATLSTKAKATVHERRTADRRGRSAKGKPPSKRALRPRKRKRRVAAVQREAPCSRFLAVAMLVVGGLAGHWYIASTTRSSGTLRIKLPGLSALKLGALLPHTRSASSRGGDATLDGGEGDTGDARAGAEAGAEAEAVAEAVAEAPPRAAELKWHRALSPNYACDEATAGLENAAPVRRGELRHLTALFFRRAELNATNAVVTLVTQVRGVRHCNPRAARFGCGGGGRTRRLTPQPFCLPFLRPCLSPLTRRHLSTELSRYEHSYAAGAVPSRARFSSTPSAATRNSPNSTQRGAATRCCAHTSRCTSSSRSLWARPHIWRMNSRSTSYV